MEIKFRGWRTDGKGWAIGTYHYSNDGKYHYILNREKFNERPDENGVKGMDEMCLFKVEVAIVTPESVGQYTGRQNIYKGDIVDVEDGADGLPDEMKAGRYIVKWDDLVCVFYLETMDGKNGIPFDETSIYTVVGNKTEHPHLLNNKQ
jgi:hypothetical protein